MASDKKNKYVSISHKLQKPYYSLIKKGLKFGSKLMPYLDNLLTKKKWINEKTNNQYKNPRLLAVKRIKPLPLNASQEEINNYQSKLLKYRCKLLDLIPYWHKRLKDKWIDPKNITLNDILKKPLNKTIVVTSDELHDYLDAISLPEDLEKKLGDATTTGSSSGGRNKTKIYAGIGDFIFTSSTYHRIFEALEVKRSDRLLVCSPITASSGPGLSRLMGLDGRKFDYTPLPCYKNEKLNKVAYERLIYYMTNKSNVMFVYTPFLRPLYNHLEKLLKGKNVKLKKIISSGGRLPDDYRKKYMNLFGDGFIICNTYGTVETSNIAFQCSEGTFHTFPEQLIRFEGGENEIFCTPLYYKNTPLINYKTKDCTEELINDCACGCKYLGFGKISRVDIFELTKQFPARQAVIDTIRKLNLNTGYIDQLSELHVNKEDRSMTLYVKKIDDYKLKGVTHSSDEEIIKIINNEFDKLPYYRAVVDMGDIKQIRIKLCDELPNYNPEIHWKSDIIQIRE